MKMIGDDMMDGSNDERELTKGEVDERMMNAESRCGFMLNDVRYNTR